MESAKEFVKRVLKESLGLKARLVPDELEETLVEEIAKRDAKQWGRGVAVGQKPKSEDVEEETRG